MDWENRFVLTQTPQGLALADLAAPAHLPLCVDFCCGASAHRRRFGGGKGQLIAKAAGIRPGLRPTVLDATAGLGQDAFVLATLGCPVTMIERHPVVAALLEDGLGRALQDVETAPIAARMTLMKGEAISLITTWQGVPPQVIYLDPMFPEREKTALVKKSMRMFRPLVGDDPDAPRLLEMALGLASHRVVVKRPRKAPALAGVDPGYRLEGKSSRYDIYPIRALASPAPTEQQGQA